MFDARTDLSVVSGHLWAKRGAWGPPGTPSSHLALGFVSCVRSAPRMLFSICLLKCFSFFILLGCPDTATE